MMPQNTDLLIINVYEITSLESLKAYGTYFLVKKSIEAQIQLKLGGRSWKELHYKIITIRSVVEKKRSDVDSLLLQNNLSVIKKKLKSLFEIKSSESNIKDLKKSIVILIECFSSNYLSPYERYEKNKKKNFKDSSKLEGINMPNHSSNESLEDILNKHMEHV